jgi:hypothetical protein
VNRRNAELFKNQCEIGGPYVMNRGIDFSNMYKVVICIAVRL